MKSASEPRRANRYTRLLPFAFALGTWWAMATPAQACDPSEPPSTYLVDERSDDTEPPTLVDARITIERAPNPGGTGQGDCSELGGYSVVVDASDDTTRRKDLGYQLRLVHGTLPFELPEGIVADSLDDGRFSTWFGDDGKAFAGTIEVRVADRAGNLSEPTEVRVGDDAVSSGCSAAGGEGLGLGALPLLAWLLLRHRTRSAASTPS